MEQKENVITVKISGNAVAVSRFVKKLSDEFYVIYGGPVLKNSQDTGVHQFLTVLGGDQDE